MLLVVPQLRGGLLELAPLAVHAGGVVWHGDYLHIAATARGFMTCRLDDLVRIPDDVAVRDQDRVGIDGTRVASFGYRYLLPVRFGYRAVTPQGHPELRYSFLSLDRSTRPPALVAGEYGQAGQSTRLARFPIDPRTSLLRTGNDGRARPVELDARGVSRMQGAVIAQGRWYLTVSQGPRTPGSVFVGAPGRLGRRRWTTPIGPEDLAYWPSTDLLWSVTEHPGRRWIYSMRRSWFG